MFFYVSKIGWFLAAPTNCLVVLTALAAVLLFTRWKRLGRAFAAFAATGLVVIGFSPLPKLIARPLEDRFPIRHEDQRPVAGIVVLGGAIGFSRGQVTYNEAAARMTMAIELAQRHPQARIVFTGGDATLLGVGTETEAEAAGRLFRMVGIAPERLVLEDRSRNTRENALFTRELVAPKAGERWLVVTSAFHMPRAIGCFRAIGWETQAFPVDYRTDGDGRDLRPFRHMFNGLQMADIIAKEWIGLLAYRLAGYTNEILPAPAEPQAGSGARSR